LGLFFGEKATEAQVLWESFMTIWSTL